MLLKEVEEAALAVDLDIAVGEAVVQRHNRILPIAATLDSVVGEVNYIVGLLALDRMKTMSPHLQYRRSPGCH